MPLRSMPWWCAEVAVFDRLQAGDQQFRHFLDAHQPAFFLLLPVQRGDARRIQPRRLRCALAGRASRTLATRPPDSDDLEPARRHRAVDIAEATAGDLPAAAVARVGAGALAAAVVAVGGGVEFGLQGLRIHRQARAPAAAGARRRGSGICQCSWPKRSLTWWFRYSVYGIRKPEPEPDRRQCPGQQALAPVRRRGVAVEIVVSSSS